MRTEYVDHEGWADRRHLLRLWLTSTVSTHAIDPQRALGWWDRMGPGRGARRRGRQLQALVRGSCLPLALVRLPAPQASHAKRTWAFTARS